MKCGGIVDIANNDTPEIFMQFYSHGMSVGRRLEAENEAVTIIEEIEEMIVDTKVTA